MLEMLGAVGLCSLGKVKHDVEGHHGNIELLDGYGEAGNGVIFVSTKGQGSRPQPNLGSATQALRIILFPCQYLVSMSNTATGIGDGKKSHL